MSNSDFPEFEAKRVEVAEQLQAAQAELPAARQAVKDTAASALAAGRKFNAIASRVIAAVRADGETSPALVQIVEQARKVRDDADAASTRARSALANVEWIVQCRSADLSQLNSLLDPAPPGGRLPEVVRRPNVGPEFVETIAFGPGHTVSDAA
jgi:cysteinyl-tRNA synthetase